jgi:hypothetical protein
MAVDSLTTVDGIGKSQDTGELVLLIADHLDWADERGHLYTLQDKMNAYASFIDSAQYQKVYPGEAFTGFVIEIVFLHQLTERAMQFIKAASSYLNGYGIRVTARMA